MTLPVALCFLDYSTPECRLFDTRGESVNPTRPQAQIKEHHAYLPRTDRCSRYWREPRNRQRNCVGIRRCGATVYVTGRSTSTGHLGIVEETAAEIDSLGGHGVPIVCDPSDDQQGKTVSTGSRRRTAVSTHSLTTHSQRRPSNPISGRSFGRNRSPRGTTCSPSERDLTTWRPHSPCQRCRRDTPWSSTCRRPVSSI